jgi:uncharacterized protein YoxC
VSLWSQIFLGVIAAATLAIAIVQVGVLVAAGLFLRRLKRFMDTVEREMTPIFGHLNAIGRDASRAAALATAQVERVDHLFSDITMRFEQVMDALQSILTPVGQGRALWKVFWKALRAILDLRQNARARRGRGDDEDALFI